MAPARGTLVNGAAIRAIREAKGWPLGKFATQLGISTGYLCNIEAGRKPRLGVDKVQAIETLLGVPKAAFTSPAYDFTEHVA